MILILEVSQLEIILKNLDLAKLIRLKNIPLIFPVKSLFKK
jgi:hypothetical protein